MKNAVRFFAAIVVCSLQYSCRIYDLYHLSSYRPKDGSILEKIITDQHDTVCISSDWTSTHPPLCETDMEENDDTYPVYKIACSKNVKPFCIKLESITVTECGEALPITVFYNPYDIGEDDYMHPAIVDSIPFIYNIFRFYAGHLYIKIHKGVGDIREMTIRYRININGKIVEEEHQFRMVYTIYTKNYELYRHWLRTCGE